MHLPEKFVPKTEFPAGAGNGLDDVFARMQSKSHGGGGGRGGRRSEVGDEEETGMLRDGREGSAQVGTRWGSSWGK